MVMAAQKTEKTLLEKFDFFQIIFLLHVVGLLIQPHLEMVIPLYYPIYNNELIRIIICAWIGYAIGRISMKFLLHRKDIGVLQKSTDYEYQFLPTLIVLQFLFVMSRYLVRGTPLFSSSPGYTKGLFLIEPTYGATRVLYILLPLSVLTYFGIQFRGKNILNTKNMIYFFCGLIPLFVGLFKGSVITYMGGLVLLYDKNYKRIKLKLRALLLIVGLLSIPIAQYYYSEGNKDFKQSASYVFQRLLVYSTEGFNFIYFANMPSNFDLQMRYCFGLEKYPEAPGITLSREMTGQQDPNFATVATLYGYCWQNGGIVSVVISFFFLGLAISSIVFLFSKKDNHPFWASFLIMLYTVLLKLVLVGEPFNDLRGPIVSLVFSIVVFSLLRKIKTISPNKENEDSLPRKSAL